MRQRDALPRTYHDVQTPQDRQADDRRRERWPRRHAWQLVEIPIQLKENCFCCVSRPASARIQEQGSTVFHIHSAKHRRSFTVARRVLVHVVDDEQQEMIQEAHEDKLDEHCRRVEGFTRRDHYRKCTRIIASSLQALNKLMNFR